MTIDNFQDYSYEKFVMKASFLISILDTFYFKLFSMLAFTGLESLMEEYFWRKIHEDGYAIIRTECTIYSVQYQEIPDQF